MESREIKNKDTGKRPIVFSDFDGSFCEKDVGHRIYKHFSGGKITPLIAEWKAGKISTRDCMRREAAMVSFGIGRLREHVEL